MRRRSPRPHALPAETHHHGAVTSASGTAPTARAVPWALAAATILSQIVWVLLPDGWRDTATALSVVLFFATSATHALLTRGRPWTARYLAITLTLGWAVEALGTTTGLPFGAYDYADSLGPALGPVPVVIPLAWAMMAYPVLLAARSIWARPVPTVLWAAAVMTAWDLFLDPQMVAEGHWTWTAPDPSLPGIPGIPAQNYAGWFITATVMMALLDRLPRDGGPAAEPAAALHRDAVPTVMLVWVYASNVLANAVFFDRPRVALWGGLVLGALLLPWFAHLRRAARTRHAGAVVGPPRGSA